MIIKERYYCGKLQCQGKMIHVAGSIITCVQACFFCYAQGCANRTISTTWMKQEILLFLACNQKSILHIFPRVKSLMTAIKWCKQIFLKSIAAGSAQTLGRMRQPSSSDRFRCTIKRKQKGNKSSIIWFSAF